MTAGHVPAVVLTATPSGVALTPLYSATMHQTGAAGHGAVVGQAEGGRCGSSGEKKTLTQLSLKLPITAVEHCSIAANYHAGTAATYPCTLAANLSSNAIQTAAMTINRIASDCPFDGSFSLSMINSFDD